MLMENLGELRQSIAAFLSVGMEEFQRSEAGGCENGGQGVGQEVPEIKL